MNFNDPKGYYNKLGVSPDATLSEIKKAYRRLALKLHPDHNTSEEATRLFQELNEAYDVLKDYSKRAEYDSLSAKIEEPTEDQYHGKNIPEPITCYVCGKVPAQPRYTIFYSVKSFLFVTEQSPIQGVFCRQCANTKSLQATLTTWLLGWWGVPWGPIYSLHALFVNLFGGEKPKDVNAKILTYQAWVFARKGKGKLARAVALIAKKFAKDEDQVNVLNTILKTFDDGEKPTRLKETWVVFGKNFVCQVLLMISIVSAVLFVIYKENLNILLTTGPNVFTGCSTINKDNFVLKNNTILEHGADLKKHGVCELQELLNEMGFYSGEIDGILGPQTSSAIQELNKLYPFKLGPATSEGFLMYVRHIYQKDFENRRTTKSSKVYELPPNGHIFYSSGKNHIAPLKIRAPNYSSNFFVKVCNPESGKSVKTLFVRTGSIVSTKVPLGTYELKYATGKEWYGENCLFGRQTVYSKADRSFSFQIQDNKVAGYNIELIFQLSDNLQTFEISPEDF